MGGDFLGEIPTTMSEKEAPFTTLLRMLSDCKANEDTSVTLFGGADTSAPHSSPEDFESILDLLDQASTEMNLGQLIHPEGFSLAEAMSCLEVMDPKMDSGMALQLKPTYTAEEAYKSQIIPTDSSLTISQIILLMDELFRAEVGFYQGHNLLQTIFTCYYLHDLRKLENAYLLVYMYATLKQCSLMRDMVQQTDISNEEDFNGIQYGFRLLDKVPTEDMLRMITLAEEDLTLKISKAKGKDLEDVVPLQDDAEKEIGFCEALLARLRLKRALYSAQTHFEKDSNKRYASAKKSLVFALAQCKSLKETHQMCLETGPPLPEGIFDLTIIRRIIFTAPPNVFALPLFDESVEFIDHLLNDFMDFCNWPNSVNTVPLLLDNLEMFCKRSSNILSRARLYKLFYHENKIWGEHTPTDLMKADLLSYGIAESDFEQEAAGLLVDHLTHIFMMYFHCQFRNHSRQRSKLMLCLQELGSLQSHAELLDLKLYQELTGFERPTKENPDPKRVMFSNYIAEFTYRVMIQFIKLGFTLELYNGYEYPVVFWYLDFLYGRWSAVKKATLEFLYQKKVKDAVEASKRARGKKAKKAKNIKKKIEPPTPTREHYLVETQQYLFRALARLITGLEYKASGGKTLGRPKFEFGSDNLRFFQRFNPFHHLRNPPCLWYSHFESSMELGDYTPEKVIAYASELFGLAKKNLDKLVKSPNISEDEITELKAVTRVALTNQINILRLGTGPKLQYNFDIHPCLPVINFVSK